MSEPKCNATLTTFVHTDAVVATAYEDDRGNTVFFADDIPDGATVTRRGDSLYRDKVVVLTCEHHPDTPEGRAFNPSDHRHENAYVQWFDDTPGATPHVDPEPPLVSDEEVAAIRDVLLRNPADATLPMKVAVAAARVRQNNVTND